MQCKEIIQVIEATFPRTAALGFDNVGLLAGRSEKEVSRIYLALDATDVVIDRAIKEGADMLITHHPLLFSAVKKVTDEDFITRRIVKLIQNDISYYAMHTNYDVLGMAELSGKIMDLQNGEVLDVTYTDEEGNPEGIGRIGNLEKDMTLEECCVYVKHRLELGSLKVFGDMQKKVHRLAISPGSGKSSIAVALEKGADVLVTGDIGHHDGIDAVEQGLAVIDAGHYGTEYIFIEDMKQFFEKKLPVLDVEETKSRFFLRLQVENRAGALANIAGVLGNNDVSIAQMVQKRSHDGIAEIVVITDLVKERHFNDAIRIMEGMSVVREISGIIRVY